MAELSDRQVAILEFIVKQMYERGYPPSVREIGAGVDLLSTSSVHSHLTRLEELGYIRRDPTKPRAIRVCYDPDSGAITERRPARFIPLVGEIAAGNPLLATENIEESYPVPTDWVGDDGTLFMLRIKGDSMINAGILDGDFVVVRQQPDAKQGEIVAALVNGETATVKRLKRDKDRVILIPENDTMEPMVYDEGVDILGVVVASFRRF